MSPMILADHYQLPAPVELVGQTAQDHYSSTAAGPAEVGVVGEVRVIAVVD